MSKTAFKIFLRFTLTAAVVSMILLIGNFIGFCSILNNYYYSPSAFNSSVLDALEQGLTTKDGEFIFSDTSLLSDGYWCILIDESGDTISSVNMPDDIPTHYNLVDIARMTRWFLNDYPVYIRITGSKIILLGYPKNSIGKYDFSYTREWFHTLPQRIIRVFILNLGFAVILAFLFGITLYKRLSELTHGISNLRMEKPVHLSEHGIFKTLSQNINQTSTAIARKNAVLSTRDQARKNWVSGISHDIRTPLSIILGHAEDLAAAPSFDIDICKKAEVITSQTLKIKKLIEDLNLISSLEYDMQPNTRKAIRICPLIRRIVSDIINSSLSDKYHIELNFKAEKSVIIADEALLERAIFNLINNSIGHNEDGCIIQITQSQEKGNVLLTISDNGKGVPESVINHIGQMPQSTHGLGLPMSYKIITALSGEMNVRNEHGFVVDIRFPL